MAVVTQKAGMITLFRYKKYNVRVIRPGDVCEEPVNHPASQATV